MTDAVSQTLATLGHWPSPVAAAAARLRAAGIEVWAVGGAVRDALLLQATKDWDFATPAAPQAVAAALPRATAVDLRLGAIHLELEDGYELTVTTFRRESGYTDRRHPSRRRDQRIASGDNDFPDFGMSVALIRLVQRTAAVSSCRVDHARCTERLSATPCEVAG